MKVLELDQKAALRICSKGAPLKRAQEVLNDMGPNWANTKRVLSGEFNTLHEPSRDGVLGGSSVRSSGSDEKVRGGNTR